MKTPQLVRFDWAMKYLLRDKANFDVLEGFLTALLNEDITILHILESESNQDTENMKFNRVDLLVEDSRQRKIIIEIQNNREVDYLERLLFGTSKVIVDNHQLGELYKNIAKIISVSILYFNLGSGDDYVYLGRTEFKGMHTNTPLIVKERKEVLDTLQNRFYFEEKDIFPKYFLIKTEKFENIIDSPLDEWIYMIKNSEVKAEFKSKNIQIAKAKLDYMKMSPTEKRRHDKYLMNLASEKDIIDNAKQEGLEKGEKIGLEKGEKIGLEKGEKIGIEKGKQLAIIAKNKQFVLAGHKAGLSISLLAQMTALSEKEVEEIIKSL